jgi:hypothetical protein
MGFCILYLSHSANLIFHVKYLYANGLGEWSLKTYSDLARNFYGFGQFFTDLPGRFSFPFLIWLGYNWDHVMVLAGARTSTTAQAKPTRRKRPADKS